MKQKKSDLSTRIEGQEEGLPSFQDTGVTLNQATLGPCEPLGSCATTEQDSGTTDTGGTVKGYLISPDPRTVFQTRAHERAAPEPQSSTVPTGEDLNDYGSEDPPTVLGAVFQKLGQMATSFLER